MKYQKELDQAGISGTVKSVDLGKDGTTHVQINLYSGLTFKDIMKLRGIFEAEYNIDLEEGVDSYWYSSLTFSEGHTEYIFTFRRPPLA